MQTTLSIRAVAGAICTAAATLLAAPAQAALQDRDLNHDSVVDAFYDTDLDITWLRDANVNGTMQWTMAVTWADGYSLGGYSDWRLPTSDGCMLYNCTNSEMGHLWYVELGNSAGTLTNTGNFQNFEPGDYWSGTEYAPTPSEAWYFDTIGGYQLPDGKNLYFFAMAVRDGDVAVVPEPQTYALLALGLTGLLAVTRRRPR